MGTIIDTFGAITLPIPVPQGKQPVSDLFLFYALDFFRTFLNSRGADAWGAVHPGSLPVKVTFAHDPEQVVFNQEHLPALYMWREENASAQGGGAAAEWLAEDILITNDFVRLMWVFPNAEQSIRRIREPIVNGLIKALAISFEIGRDPSWIVPGDPDPQATTYGSVFVRWAGALSVSLTKWQRKALLIRTTDNQKSYETIEAQLTLQEELLQDVDNRYSKLGAGGLDQQLFDATGTLLTNERII